MTEHPSLDVLVVEDESLIRWAVSKTLAESGHHVREAGDATSALALLEGQTPPDVALVDYRLPDTTGLELLRALRTRAPHMAIVMMTADRTGDIADVTKLGVFEVLEKPFEMSTVESVLVEAVARS